MKDKICYPCLFLFALLNSVLYSRGNTAAASFRALLMLLECRAEHETVLGSLIPWQREPRIQLPATLNAKLLSVGLIWWVVGEEPIFLPPRLSVSREKSIRQGPPKRTLFIAS